MSLFAYEWSTCLFHPFACSSVCVNVAQSLEKRLQTSNTDTLIYMCVCVCVCVGLCGCVCVGGWTQECLDCLIYRGSMSWALSSLFVFLSLPHTHTHAKCAAGPPSSGRSHIPTVAHAFWQGIMDCSHSNYEVLGTSFFGFIHCWPPWRYQNHTISMRACCGWVYLLWMYFMQAGRITSLCPALTYSPTSMLDWYRQNKWN